MATETSARAEPSHRDELQERDYQAFFTALSTSARGRAFLAEYARRNRNADTELLLAAIDKLQTLAAANKEPAKADPARSQLHALLDEIIGARSELDANILTMQAAKLTDLIVMVERRIGTIIASLPAERVIEVESVSSGESEMQPFAFPPRLLKRAREKKVVEKQHDDRGGDHDLLRHHSRKAHRHGENPPARRAPFGGVDEAIQREQIEQTHQ